MRGDDFGVRLPTDSVFKSNCIVLGAVREVRNGIDPVETLFS